MVATGGETSSVRHGSALRTPSTFAGALSTMLGTQLQQFPLTCGFDFALRGFSYPQSPVVPEQWLLLLTNQKSENVGGRLMLRHSTHVTTPTHVAALTSQHSRRSASVTEPKSVSTLQAPKSLTSLVLPGGYFILSQYHSKKGKYPARKVF